MDSICFVALTHVRIRVESGLSELGDPLLHDLQLRTCGNVILGKLELGLDEYEVYPRHLNNDMEFNG